MNKIYCWECGKEIFKDATVCSNCGAKKNDFLKKGTGSNSNNSNKKPMPLWAWILIIIFGLPVIILILIIIIALIIGMTSTENNPGSDVNTFEVDLNFSGIMNENYNLIQTGMTKKKADFILGEKPIIGNVEITSRYKIERYYQNLFSMKAITTLITCNI
jgi:hypothetical protein